MLSMTVPDIVVIYTCFRLFYLGHRIPRGSSGFTFFLLDVSLWVRFELLKSESREK